MRVGELAGDRTVYHTYTGDTAHLRPGCPNLKRSKRVRETPAAEYYPDVEVCGTCLGGKRVSRSRYANSDTYHGLLEADPEDLGLPARGERR